VACQTALATAPALPVTPVSPTPLMPSALTWYSIRRFGFTNPVLIDAGGQIIAGHGRVEAAKLLGLAAVPAIRLSHLSEIEKRAYILADNRLAEKAGWDKQILAIELQALIDLDFEVELTGFEAPYVDMILDDHAEANAEAPGPEDDVPDPPAVGAAVSRLGDVWALGPHRLLCGNALEPASYQTLMAGDLAEMVFTDPPYNVRIDGNVCGAWPLPSPGVRHGVRRDDRGRFYRIPADCVRTACRH